MNGSRHEKACLWALPSVNRLAQNHAIRSFVLGSACLIAVPGAPQRHAEDPGLDLNFREAETGKRGPESGGQENGDPAFTV